MRRCTRRCTRRSTRAPFHASFHSCHRFIGLVTGTVPKKQCDKPAVYVNFHDCEGMTFYVEKYARAREALTHVYLMNEDCFVEVRAYPNPSPSPSPNPNPNPNPTLTLTLQIRQAAEEESEHCYSQDDYVDGGIEELLAEHESMDDGFSF